MRASRTWCVCAVIVLAACTHRDRAQNKAEAIRQGDELAGQKRYSEAAKAYQLAVNSDPTDGQARLKLVDSLTAAGNLRQAGSEAVTAADLLPHNLEAQRRAARFMVSQGQFIDAADKMSALLKDHPGDVDAQIIWGNATARLLDSSGALSKLSEVIRDDNKYYAARRDFRQVTTRADDLAAEEAFRQAQRHTPTTMEAQMALANFLWVAGRPDQSEEVLRRVADQDPGHTIVNRALGEFYLSRHRDVDGERYLKNAAAMGDRVARFALADFYSQKNRDNDALTILSSMPAEDNATGEISLRLAALEFRASKTADAMRRLDGLLASNPQNGRARLLKARIMFATGNSDPKFARDAVEVEPSSGEARELLGRALLAAGDLENAFQEFSEAFRLDPESTESAVELTRLSVSLGRGQSALQYAREAVRRNPDNRDIAVTLVKILIDVHDLAGAERALNPLLSRYPSAPDVRAQLGALQLARGDYEAARAAFDRALQSDRSLFEAISGLVSVDLKQRRIASARQRADAALATHPTDGAYLLLAAQAYAAADDSARTEATLRRALELDRTNERAASTLSDFLARRGRLDDAKSVLDSLLERRPRSLEAQTSRGLLLEQMHRPADARAQYEKTVAQSSRAALAASRLAALYVDQNGNLEVALALAISARQELPNDPAIGDVLGWVYTQKNLPALALPHLQEAARAVPNNPRYRFHLASAYLRAGQLTQAKEEFNRALQLDPNFAEAQQARSALESLAR